MELGVTAYSHISPEKVVKNKDILYSNKDKLDFNTYSKDIYRHLGLSYAKFYKMDELCKLAFLASEVLLSDKELHSTEDGADIAIILGNRSSSISSDQKHFNSIRDKENFFPSPAVFVYTLPNIMLGELCIRYKITGENNCFLMENFNAEFFYNYVKELFEKENYRYCITGWINYEEDKYEAKLYLVEEQTSTKQDYAKFKTDFDKITVTI